MLLIRCDGCGELTDTLSLAISGRRHLPGAYGWVLPAPAESFLPKGEFHLCYSCMVKAFRVFAEEQDDD